MAGNGSDHPPGPTSDLVRLVATLETTLGKLVEGQRALRAELRAFGGRVEALAGKVDTLAARTDDLAEKVHRSNNLLMSLTNDTSVLRESQHALDRALEFIETQQKAKLLDLERAHQAIARAVDFVEARVRAVRDEVADLTGGEGGDGG